MPAGHNTTRRTRISRRIRAGVVGAVAAALAATAFTAAPAQAADRAERGHETTQRALESLVAAGYPGVVAEARDSDGVWQGRAGVRDLRTGAPRDLQDRYRIGSVTKTFVATVLLQMEAEGRLDLDDTVEKHLPGLVRGNGNDGRKITVRQLLNHTSGLYNYTNDPAFAARTFVAPGFFQHRYDSHAPRDLVRIGLSHRPDFAPGTDHAYSNTGYILAGLIIEKISGTSYEQQVRQRIVKPLKLRHTSLPGDRPDLPAPSSRNYSTLSEDPAETRLHDVTANNMSWGWAAGDMISTTSDVNRFLGALLRGKLLPAAQLDAMKTAVPVAGNPMYKSYGLGLYSVRNSCDRELWGHSGGVIGSGTEATGTADGRHLLTYTANGEQGGGTSPVEAEFCGVTGKGAGPAGEGKSAGTAEGAGPRTPLR
ncbi:serine hydrolase domain-containing protein [Streptomyces sp. NPDC000594]|uniref:serine hydrolase domain-containing protein n=1 Tax=Streptomyces sp. NPDC000594 TaxID=3154261 RepID=UPI003318059C